MRVNKYIREKKISLSELNWLCEYLFINKVKISTKIPDDYVILFDETLNSKIFNEWYRSKTQVHKNIEFSNALILIKLINYKSTTEVNDYLGLRIIKSLSYLIEKGKFLDYQESMNEIIHSDKNTLEKITQLRNIKPFKKPKKTSSQNTIEDEYVVEIDPYENFNWGGLSGEEAHTAYWNCD